MTAKLLLIDPQNDFCDIPDAALPVPGADADMERVAAFIRAAGGALAEVVVTLDSHATVGIERPTFWQQGDGRPLVSLTQITEESVRQGRYQPRRRELLSEVLAYLQALEAGGRYRLMVWPVHCVVGTWGHNMHAAVSAAISAWEEEAQRGAVKVMKGLNPLTEQYSAVRAEVPREDDPATDTNALLVRHAQVDDGMLFVAGEASSHCVAATMADLIEMMSSEQRARVVILRDCMSPVQGFETHSDQFFARMAAQGARIMASTEALAALA